MRNRAKKRRVTQTGGVQGLRLPAGQPRKDPALITSLWTKYLQLEPTDPQDGTIRQELAKIKAQSSSK